MRISTTVLIILGLTVLVAIIAASISAAESIDIASGTTPTLDSTLSPNEWADAGHVNISVAGANGSVYFKHDGEKVYFAFLFISGHMAEVYVDKDHDDGSSPGTDDVCMHASAALLERTGTGTDWSGWTTSINGWDADTLYVTVREFAIDYSFLDITAGTPKTMGVLLYMFNTTEGGFWPSTGDLDDPSTWGDMNSSDAWLAAPNNPPLLSTPTVAPLSGDTSTDFRFEVKYKDAEGLPPTIARLHLDASPHDMMTDSSGPWDEWVTYYFETRLSAGNDHLYHFTFSDGRDTVRFPAINDTPNRLDGPVVTPPNRAPLLEGALHDPTTGTRMDTYEFTVIYIDHDNDAAATTLLYLDDDTFVMTPGGDEWSKGVNFAYSTSLGLGTHTYYFLFSDGKEEVRLPPTGHLEGPSVYNLDPTAVISAPEDGARFAPDDHIPFSSFGSSDPEGDSLAYTWTSDLDGHLGDLWAFDMRLSEGSHTITLNVTDGFGGSDSTEVGILVKPYLPRPFIESWSASIVAPIEGDTMRYTVIIGNDGEANIQGLVVSFLLDGAERVTDTVGVDVGSTVDVVFTWIVEPGDFTVRFEIGGDHVEFVQHVDPNTVPLADIHVAGGEGEPPRYREGHPLTFSIDVEDAEGDTLTIVWDMDDGTTASAVQTVHHTYESGGKYEVTVSIEDPRGGRTSSSFTLIVNANSLPVVEIDFVPVTVRGDTVSFSANVSDADGDALTYLWDFGDGDDSTWEAPKHIYEEPGTYTVTLTVTDSEGGVTEKAIEVVIERPEKDDGDESPGFGVVLAVMGVSLVFIIVSRHRDR